jgi:2-keto-4-pentenoate hydratase/2-oxohepta-3-ene-1,7-dioic acid hydratase in catechol pathway
VSVVAPGADVEYPPWTEELTYAGELAAVIDEECTDLAEDEVDDAVRGYTIVNDLDALDQPGRTARKAFDGSGPLGPWIETDLDPDAVDMTTHVGGELRQEANTELMLFSPREVVSFLSERYTFKPGDVVSFGSPANPGLVEPGDEVEIWYEGVGTLRNTVVEAE